MKLPNDPIMLMSVVNTMLRDKYSSPDQLCNDCELDRTELDEKLRKAGFEYKPEQNQYR